MFLSYLPGIETCDTDSVFIEDYGFYRTYQELKQNKDTGEELDRRGFYRTYQELKLKYRLGGFINLSVFIVPTRNWNCYLAFLIFWTSDGFYRTYQELKRGDGNSNTAATNVFIVPTRNWNILYGEKGLIKL